MDTKICFKCKIALPLEDFYAHPQMADGHVNKCKECNKNDVRENYAAKRDKYAVYEKLRQQTSNRRKKKQAYQKNRRLANPEKAKVHQKVAYAIKSGKLVRQPCEKCGRKAQAHHEDYSKPLDVMWLCFTHHREQHGQTVIDKNYEQ